MLFEGVCLRAKSNILKRKLRFEDNNLLYPNKMSTNKDFLTNQNASIHISINSLLTSIFNQLLTRVWYKNRTTLIHTHNMALNRAFFFRWVPFYFVTINTFCIYIFRICIYMNAYSLQIFVAVSLYVCLPFCLYPCLFNQSTPGRLSNMSLFVCKSTGFLFFFFFFFGLVQTKNMSVFFFACLPAFLPLCIFASCLFIS